MLEWDFIEAVLNKFGFNKTWIHWVMTTIRTTSFSVLVNDVPGERFEPSRGIRQGDPLAPFIFIISMEALARTLQKEAEARKNLVGIKLKPRGTPIPFLSFADDTLIFSKAGVGNLNKIMDILYKFSYQSGLKINIHKSSLQVSKNISSSEARSLAGAYNLPLTRALEKYLGIPIVRGRINNSVFEDVVSNLKTHISRWKASTLSQAGRAVLINANISSKSYYLMQSFLLPKGILEKLDKINKDFFWNKIQNDRYHPLISWDDICENKERGGLGIKNSFDMNCALQERLLWRIISEPTNMWVRIINEKYIRDKDIFNIPRTNTSWQFGRLLSLRDKFRRGLQWLVGNGKDINFWSDPWIPDNDISHLTPPDDSFRTVASVILPSREWNIPLLHSLLPTNLVNIILTIRIPDFDTPDKTVWKLSGNGSFSVKTAFQSTKHHSKPRKIEFDWIWSSSLPPQIKNFLWKITADALPTKARLNRHFNRSVTTGMRTQIISFLNVLSLNVFTLRLMKQNF